MGGYEAQSQLLQTYCYVLVLTEAAHQVWQGRGCFGGEAPVQAEVGHQCHQSGRGVATFEGVPARVGAYGNATMG